mmetsp:Transcript_35175/g.40114  ORF Transcript_35175/g.40114 Transcript_35175/m.40114 type:complete len:164 (+) Transcript_35175:137-628(+)
MKIIFLPFLIPAIFALAPPQLPKAVQNVLKDNKLWITPVTTVAIGWVLATGMAGATNTVDISAINSNTVIVSELENLNLDFSLPSYDSKKVGFGEGARSKSEAVKTGILENDLQAQAVKKAEAARLERVAAKKAEKRAMEEDIKIRAREKKIENDRRMKELFN